jgi:endo-1,4-beta-xylanase
MKFTTAIAALAGVAMAAPVAETEVAGLEKRATPINYVQNYNGNLANFKYNQGAGTYSASWNNPGDFVVGLGWNKGSSRSALSEFYLRIRLDSHPLQTDHLQG